MLDVDGCKYQLIIVMNSIHVSYVEYAGLDCCVHSADLLIVPFSLFCFLLVRSS